MELIVEDLAQVPRGVVGGVGKVGGVGEVGDRRGWRSGVGWCG